MTSMDLTISFVNAIHCTKPIDVILNRIKSPVCSQWREQSKFDFGFIPLSDFILPQNNIQNNRTVACSVALHNEIKHSGQYNYLGCRIPVASQLNRDVCEQELNGYWDVQLIDLITPRF